MSHPWMPFYVADYLADTGHLSTAQHGAYLLLIMHYWQNGALPADEAKLARICRLSSAQWAAMRGTLAGLFSEGWTHKRIDAEIARTEERYRKRVEISRKGGLATANARRRSAVTAPEAQPRSANHNHNHKEEPLPPSEVSPRAAERGSFLPEAWAPSPANLDWAVAQLGGEPAAARTLERFRNYWLARPGKEGRKRDWDLTWRNWVNEEVDRADRNARSTAHGVAHRGPPRTASGHDALIAAVAERVLGGDERPPAASPGRHGADRHAAGLHLPPHRGAG